MSQENNIPGQFPAPSAGMTACQVEDRAVELLRVRGVAGREEYDASMDRRDLTLKQWARHYQDEQADALQYGIRLEQAGDLLVDAREIVAGAWTSGGLSDAETARCARWLQDYQSQFGDVPAAGSVPAEELGQTKVPGDEIISWEEIERVHGSADFGSTGKRAVVNGGVLKCASGYHGGSTQTAILTAHGLITKDYELTAKGRSYLWEVFSHGMG